MNCPLCNSSDLSLMASRKSVPALQNVLCDNPQKSTEIPRGDIALYSCNSCEFVFNASYKQVDYGENYENYQGCSPLFDDYLTENAKRAATRILRQKQPVLLIEIGCGQGDFTNRILSNILKDFPISAIGFDPAYRGGEAAKDARCKFFPTYFDEKAVERVSSMKDFPVKICVSRHVIEHIQNPDTILKACAALEGNAHVFLETPNVEWIQKHHAFEDVVYEHCSFYSPKSMLYLLQKYDFSLTEFRSTFGGQYMWIEAEKQASAAKRCALYRKGEEELFHKWRSRLKYTRGGIFVWGAGAKGVAFLNEVDPKGEYVSKVIDINPKKQGKYLSGSGHGIAAPEYLKTIEGPKTLIVMNENYLQEIKDCVEKMGVEEVSYMKLHE